ncbi:MAG: glycosyltransferase family 39 protein [Anaerolineales bacterium]|nr:MAG: glycosyltransferase family 39 protein [Anaerolineales bacterium]
MASSQRNLATCLLAGGSMLAILGQIVQAALPLGQRTESMVLLFCGLVFYLLGILTARDEKISAQIEHMLKRPGIWLNLEPWQVVAIFLSIFYSILAHFAAGDGEKMISPIGTWAAWLISIGLYMLGCWKPNDLNLRSKWKPFLFALGFAFLALPFRAIATNYIPILLNGDEASAGLHGIRFIEGESNNPFSAGWYSFPGLYFLVPSASISLFGNTTAALRIPSAIAGALTVGGIYLTGHAMFGKRTGLIAALALTGFHFHMHFSRIGLNNIWDGLFFVITVGAAWYAWERESRNAFLLAGLGLGLSQYFYPSSRALLIVVFGGLISTAIFNLPKLKRSLANMILMTLGMIVVFLPLAWYYIIYPEQYLAPLSRVSILGSWLENEVAITGLPAWRILLKQIGLGVLAFTHLPLQHWYRPETSFLRPLYAGFFLLGSVHLMTRPKDSRSIFLLLWLAVYVLLGGLSESTPAAQRYVAAAPVCILILARGLDKIGDLVERLWQRSARVLTIVLIGIAVFLSADDINFYFNTYTPKTVIDFGGGASVIAQHLANDLKDKPRGTQAFFFTTDIMGYYSIPSISYLAPQVQGFDVHQPWGSAENPVPESDHLVFIFLPEVTSYLPDVETAYPNGVLHERKDVDQKILYWLYEYENTP